MPSRFDGCCIIACQILEPDLYRGSVTPSVSLGLSLTPGVETDQPESLRTISPSVRHVEDPTQYTNALHTVMIFGGSTDSRIRDDPQLLQFRKEPLDIGDVKERHTVVSLYPHTELLLQMAVDAWRCSTLHRTNCSHDLAYRKIPVHSSVSATIHAPEQKANFALVRAGCHRKLHKHLSGQRCKSVRGERLSTSKPQVRSKQLAVPRHWRAPQLSHRSAGFAELRAVGSLGK